MDATLVAGDSVDFVTSVPAYPASQGFTLCHRLTPWVAGAAIDMASVTVDIDDYRTLVSNAVSALWVPGDYSWASWVEKAGERHSVDSGLCKILPDPATATAYDGRSKAQKALEDCQTALANFNAAGGKVKRYSIAGREMEFDNATDIMVLVSYWTNEVRLENRGRALREGQADPSRIYMRLGRA